MIVIASTATTTRAVTTITARTATPTGAVELLLLGIAGDFHVMACLVRSCVAEFVILEIAFGHGGVTVLRLTAGFLSSLVVAPFTAPTTPTTTALSAATSTAASTTFTPVRTFTAITTTRSIVTLHRAGIYIRGIACIGCMVVVMVMIVMFAAHQVGAVNDLALFLAALCSRALQGLDAEAAGAQRLIDAD